MPDLGVLVKFCFQKTVGMKDAVLNPEFRKRPQSNASASGDVFEINHERLVAEIPDGKSICSHDGLAKHMAHRDGTPAAPTQSTASVFFGTMEIWPVRSKTANLI
jgi:hypothetical protein